MTEGPGKEYRSSKPPPIRRVWERSKGNTTCPSTSQNYSCWQPSWLSNECAASKDPESEWLAKDNLETNSIPYLRPWASGRAVLLDSLILLLSTWVPLPNKVSWFVNMNVSMDDSFPSVRQEPTLRPWKGFPFLQQYHRLNPCPLHWQVDFLYHWATREAPMKRKS